MELVLAKNAQDQATVTCDGQSSHIFHLSDLLPQRQDDQLVLTNPVETGTRLFAALFADGSPAHTAWSKHPKRILLVAEDPALDTIPWEYLYGPDGFIVLDAAFVRGLSASQRQPAPDLTGIPLHIVAIPSNPIDRAITRLDIAGEWTRLKESINGLETAIRLERVRPPTLEQARRLVANQRHRIVHFMGHGGHSGADSFLLFENEQGGPKGVTAQDFSRRMEDSAFLVTLNACVSAMPGATEFSNLARTLTERGVPYALGMRFSIPDDDAKAFSQTFYSELARGSSLENALRQARNSLADSKNPWAVGTPVLYTSLNEAAKGFETPPGAPRIDEHQPPLEVSVMPRAEGAFQGRVDELLALGQALTSEPRTKLLTIHGPGGQGKTALAREASERFAHAWPGGVWAVSLEHNAALDRFMLELARFFKIDLDGIYKQVASAHPNLEMGAFQERVQQELERRILALLNHQRTLLVLDNAETFVEAVDAKEKSALDLAVFLREKVLSTQASLLLTSREHLGWTGEQALELAGLSDEEGAQLFTQCALSRGKDTIGPQREEISRKVEGHPLSLRLLGGAFDASRIALEEFADEVETTLLQAEDKYKHEDHRHRTLFASIETSVRYLDETERALLSVLWIFRSPFQSGAAGVIFTPPDLSEVERKIEQDQIFKRLYTIFQRGLSSIKTKKVTDGEILLYYITPTVGLYAKHYLAQEFSENLMREKKALAYYNLIASIAENLQISDWASYLAENLREDIDECATLISDDRQGWYAYYLGTTLQRIGNWDAGLRWLERALELSQNRDSSLEINTLGEIGALYQNTGFRNQSLIIFEQLIVLYRSIGDTAGEAQAVANLGLTYQTIGEVPKALDLFFQALDNIRTTNNQIAEATLLSNIGNIYRSTGEVNKALEFFKQALPLRKANQDLLGEATTLISIGVLQEALGNYAESLRLHTEALPLFRSTGNKIGESRTLNNLGVLYKYSGEIEKAQDFYIQALSLSQSAGDQDGEAQALSSIADLYSVTGKVEQAVEIYEQALSIFRKIMSKEGEVRVLNNLAVVYQSIGKVDKVQELYQQSLEICRLLGALGNEAKILNNIGRFNETLGNLNAAINYHQQALALFQSVSDSVGEATALANLGVAYRSANRNSEALLACEQALPIFQLAGDLANEAATINNLALTYHVIGKWEEALNMYEQALPLMRKVGNPASEATLLNNMSILLYVNLSRPDDAISHLEKSIFLLIKHNLHQEAVGIEISVMQNMLDLMRFRLPLSPPEVHPPEGVLLSLVQIATILDNTLFALIDVKGNRLEWRQEVSDLINKTRAGKGQIEVDFLEAVSQILDSKEPFLPDNHPYKEAIKNVMEKLTNLP